MSNKLTPEGLEIIRNNKLKLATCNIVIGVCIFYSLATGTILVSQWVFGLAGYLPNWFILLVSFLVAVALEYGGFSFASDAIEDKLHNRDKEDIITWWFTVVLCVICYAISATISYQGTPTVYGAVSSKPTIESTFNVDSTLNNERLLVVNNYSNDSLLIKKNYNQLVENNNAYYQSKIDFQKTKLKKHKKDKINGNEWAQGWIDKRNGIISQLNVDKSAKKAEIRTKELGELTLLLKSKNELIADAKSTHKIGAKNITDKNDEAINGYNSKAESTTLYMRYGVFISIPVMLFCLFLIKRIYRRAEYVKHIKIDDSYFRENPISRIYDVVKSNVSNRVNNRIEDMEYNKVKPKYKAKEDFVNLREDKIVLKKNEDFKDIAPSLSLANHDASLTAHDMKSVAVMAVREEIEKEKKTVTPTPPKKEKATTHVGTKLEGVEEKTPTVVTPTVEETPTVVNNNPTTVVNNPTTVGTTVEPSINVIVNQGLPFVEWNGVKRDKSWVKKSLAAYISKKSDKIKRKKSFKTEDVRIDQLTTVLLQLEKKSLP